MEITELSTILRAEIVIFSGLCGSILSSVNTMNICRLLHAGCMSTVACGEWGGLMKRGGRLLHIHNPLSSGRSWESSHNTTRMVTQSMDGSKFTGMVVLSLLSALSHPSVMITHSSGTVARMGPGA